MTTAVRNDEMMAGFGFIGQTPLPAVEGWASNCQKANAMVGEIGGRDTLPVKPDS